MDKRIRTIEDLLSAASCRAPGRAGRHGPGGLRPRRSSWPPSSSSSSPSCSPPRTSSLDYVMGFLLLVEGPFFKGDYVVVRDHTGVEGVVEEIGLRRTPLRDQNGSSHAVSNGPIRLSSNLTRLFSVAVVELHVMRAADLDRSPLDGGRASRPRCGADPAWADRFGDGRRDRHLGHRDRPRWGLAQGPAARSDGCTGGGRERAAAAVDRRWWLLRSGPGGGTRRC